GAARAPALKLLQPPLVSFTDVNKTYDGTALVVRDLNLDIRRGEFLTLLGPSGSGKTTTLMMLAGFETPTEGEISLAGVPITRTPPHKRNFGMVFQNYALFPHMTVEQNVAYPLSVRNIKGADQKTKVATALDMVQLGALGSRYPGQLSGGQQQRVALARALASRPSLLLLDEPFAALNPLLRQGLREELRHIGQRWQVPIVLITHDVDDVLALADVAFVFDAGAVVRELCLHSGRSRELARQTLTPPPLRPRREVDDLCLHALLAPLSHA
ncbi:MAG TPA: ABC transporter ATP-binding protein, partial [Burkholderiaceae bacterium]|nr:ABC transporter ATP-binding protein [Burkholderiaceae bacterium]